MRQYVFLAVAVACSLLASCKKNSGASDVKPIDKEPQIVTVANITTYPSGYVVKTIGFSRIVLGVDANDKLTVAELYGGGNKVVLKSGTGNVAEILNFGNFYGIPKQLGPDMGADVLDEAIDNGRVSSDTTGGKALCIKLKGFDKSKTGYNQLNLVMHKMVRVPIVGYDTNIAFIPYSTSKDGYSVTLFKSFFTGNVQVADVQMAAPVSAKPYITEDHVVYMGQGAFSPVKNQTTSLTLGSYTFETNTNYQSSNPIGSNTSIGSNFKYEWVNADKGTVARYNEDVFGLNLSNLKSDDVVVGSDSTKYPFLRITGFNSAIVGFNQLRLFVANKNKSYNGELSLITLVKQPTTPSLETAKSMFITGKLYTNIAQPVVHHH